VIVVPVLTENWDRIPPIYYLLIVLRWFFHVICVKLHIIAHQFVTFFNRKTNVSQ